MDPFEVICIDNKGWETSFELNVTYLCEGVLDFYYDVEDANGVLMTVFQSRFKRKRE